MSKSTNAKHVENVSMSFTDPPKKDASTSGAQPTIAPEDLEELKENGQLVYRKNKKTGDIKFFVQEKGNDGKLEDKEVTLDLVDTLEREYPAAPETNDNDYPKKGDLKVRFTKEEFGRDEATRKMMHKTVDVPFDDCDLIVERQDYEDGDAFTKTIVKKHYNLVRLLRGDIGGKKEEK